MRPFHFLSATSDSSLSHSKRQRFDFSAASSSYPDQIRLFDSQRNDDDSGESKDNDSKSNLILVESNGASSDVNKLCMVPKFGVASVCGRRRDMEDAVAVHPSFYREHENVIDSESHYFGVYDGHGCSHVAWKCKERLHELVKEEFADADADADAEWKVIMEKSFGKMDKEVSGWNEGVVGKCRCELQTPECDAVGSTAVVAIVNRDKIIVANCVDSRAVLSRNGNPLPLSSDHKPDRPDELHRIQEAGGRVIYWDGPRVLGVLAMSRAIGDNHLKPYVSWEPEVTVTERTREDECLILASDGLWDVVSNDTACGVARMCLVGKVTSTAGGDGGLEEEVADSGCTDASMLLTKLALARHTGDNVSVVVVNLRN